MDLLANTPGSDSDAPVVAFDGQVWSRGGLAGRVRARAEALRQQGVAGTVWSPTLHPDPVGIVELLAGWSAGAVVAPLSPRLSPTERAHAEGVLAREGSRIPPETVAILWTSGTAGVPRGVALTEAGLRANADQSRSRLGLAPGDVWYASLSLAHVGGLALVTRALLLESVLVAPGRFDLDGLVSALREGTAGGAITHLSLVPTQLGRLLEAWGSDGPPASLRCILVGGAATPPSLLRASLEAGWPVGLTYGMTEMTSQVATAPPDRVRSKPGTVGSPLPGVQLLLADDGEILVRGATLAAGYVGSREALLGSDGWYHSGDLGRLDEDGDLWIVGRQSDRIITGGVTVDPREVESALRSHPDVRDACVVGVPDPEWGERVAALVVPGDRAVTPDALAEWASTRLGPARRPRLWALADHLPLNRNGKVDRRRVQAEFSTS